jgi:hypothetical protein
MENKRGQLAIIVIVALIIVAGVIVFLLRSRISILGGGDTFSAQDYLKTCITPEIQSGMKILNAQGGYSNPEGFIYYDNVSIKYLCHSSEFYQRCVIQQPMIKSHYEKELKAMIDKKAETCFNDLKGEYSRRGYETSGSYKGAEVEFVPGKLKVIIDSPITVTKESSQTLKGFNFEMNSKMYEILMLTTSIIDYEATYGNSETTLYIQYYPDLLMYKNQLSDGTRIYTLGDAITGENFTFASRSLVWPPGYGLTL